ncbi:MAG: hypothetical protein AAF968_07780 [Pseudomonadota bacterium]
MSGSWLLLLLPVILFSVLTLIIIFFDLRQVRNQGRLEWQGSAVAFHTVPRWPQGALILIAFPFTFVATLGNDIIWDRYWVFATAVVLVCVFDMAFYLWRLFAFWTCPRFEGTQDAFIKRDRYGSEDRYEWRDLRAVTLEPPARWVLWRPAGTAPLGWYRATLDFGPRGKVVLPRLMVGTRFLEERLAAEAEQRGVPIRGREREDLPFRDIRLA